MTKNDGVAWDMSQKFEGEGGRVLTREQMAMGRWKEGADLVRTADGYVFNGELFTPIDDLNRNLEE